MGMWAQACAMVKERERERERESERESTRRERVMKSMRGLSV